MTPVYPSQGIYQWAPHTTPPAPAEWSGVPVPPDVRHTWDELEASWWRRGVAAAQCAARQDPEADDGDTIVRSVN